MENVSFIACRESVLVRDEGKQCDVSRSLDRFSHFALVQGASSGDSSRNDLAALGNELGSESSENHLFVIYRHSFVCALRLIDAEGADFTSRLAKFIRFCAGSAGCGCHSLSVFLSRKNRDSSMVVIHQRTDRLHRCHLLAEGQVC